MYETQGRAGAGRNAPYEPQSATGAVVNRVTVLQ
jgi:hypothetical protein